VAFIVSRAVSSAHRLVASLTRGVRSLCLLPLLPSEGVVAGVVSVTRSENTTEWPSSEFKDMKELLDAMLAGACARGLAASALGRASRAGRVLVECEGV